MRCRVSVMALALAGLPAAGQCQYEAAYFGGAAAQKETVVGTGAASVELPPTQLRMFVQLSAKGKTMEEAMAKLKERRSNAVAQLEKLGADKHSITLANLGTGGASENQRRQQMQEMIRQRMRGGKAKAIKLPEVVNLSETVSAQWPLGVSQPDEILMVVHKLQMALKEAQLGGKDAGLTPEEQELMEETEGAAEMYSSYGQQETPPGTPYFFYVATIPEQQQRQAMAEAFEKATAQASSLAQAAGFPLGRAVSVSGGLTPGGDFNSGMDEYMPNRFRNIVYQQMGRRGRGTKTNEAISATPNGVTFQFHIQAAFALLPSAQGKK